MKYLYDPPGLLKNLFKDFYWETRNHKILLTFDDAPNPDTTEIILKKLSDEKIKALFFCVGENVKKYPDLVSQIISEGHSVGNHTLNHKNLNNTLKNESDYQILSVNMLFEERYNLKLKFFRPPYGRFSLSTNKLLRKFELKNVMWSLLTYDYKNDISVVKFATEKYLKKNSIIVLHDSNKSKNIIFDSISLITENTFKKNYQFGRAEECLS